MDVAQKIHLKLEKILLRLKVLKIIQTFKLEINFGKIEESLITSLVEIDSILKKCVKKIIAKPKKAEIRNVIAELVRKKNLNVGIMKSKNEFKVKKFMYNRDFENCSKNLNVQIGPSKGCNKGPTITKNYLCEFCGEIFYSSLNWKDHKKKHEINSRHKCENCHESFSSLKKLRNHFKTHDKKSFDGNLSTIFSSTNEIKSITHDLFANLDSSAGQLYVGEANKSAFEKVEIKEAEDTLGNYNYFCQCGKNFRLLKTLKKHKSLKHSFRKEIHNCTICKKNFMEKGKLNRHMLSHKCSQHQCSTCLRRFTRSDALKRHNSIVHKNQKEFSCRFCQKKFHQKFNKDVHEENTHKNINSWIQCDICGQKLKNKITLKGHIKIHSENRINCEVCGKTFIRKVSYKHHMKNRHLSTI